jgi:DNA-binding GntR family transcriptional regulator
MPTTLLIRPLEDDDQLSLAERAYRRVRDAIVRGQLAAGTKVSERGLAASLGISPQPVREALRRLEAEGMVVTQPRSGTVVAAIGPERLAELGRIRMALEGAGAALAAERITEAELAALAEVVAGMRRATEAADRDALAELNERFHALLHAAAGQSFIARSLDSLRAYDQQGQLRSLGSRPNAMPQALSEHVGILAALRRRDPDLAERRMRAHVLRSLVTNGVLRGKA